MTQWLTISEVLQILCMVKAINTKPYLFDQYITYYVILNYPSKHHNALLKRVRLFNKSYVESEENNKQYLHQTI